MENNRPETARTTKYRVPSDCLVCTEIHLIRCQPFIIQITTHSISGNQNTNLIFTTSTACRGGLELPLQFEISDCGWRGQFCCNYAQYLQALVTSVTFSHSHYSPETVQITNQNSIFIEIRSNSSPSPGIVTTSWVK